jgi:hypothetical protein
MRILSIAIAALGIATAQNAPRPDFSGVWKQDNA